MHDICWKETAQVLSQNKISFSPLPFATRTCVRCQFLSNKKAGEKSKFDRLPMHFFHLKVCNPQAVAGCSVKTIIFPSFSDTCVLTIIMNERERLFLTSFGAWESKSSGDVREIRQQKRGNHHSRYW